MTKNVPPTQVQREVITNRGSRSPFKAHVKLVTCVHGRISEEDPQLASLIVLEYHVGCTGGKHRYNSLTTKLSFQSQVPKGLEEEPIVKAYAPFQLTESLDPIEVERVKRWKAESSLGATFTPANASATLGKESETKYTLNMYAFGQAFTEYTDGKSGCDAVLWELRENKIRGTGVPDTFRCAVLIQRANSNRFTGEFSLKLHAGIWFAAFEDFKSVFGLIEADDPIIFDPSMDPQGETAGIVPANLGVFREQSSLGRLTPIHLL